MLVGGIFYNLALIYYKINLLDCGGFFLAVKSNPKMSSANSIITTTKKKSITN